MQVKSFKKEGENKITDLSNCSKLFSLVTVEIKHNEDNDIFFGANRTNTYGMKEDNRVIIKSIYS